MKIEFTNQLTGETVEGVQKIKPDGSILVDFPDTFTLEQIKEIEKVFNDARTSINRHLQELSSLSFKFLTNLDLKKFEEAERLMGQMATASVALSAWKEITPHLKEFENPVQAMIAGLMLVDKKFKVIEDLKKGTHEKIV